MTIVLIERDPFVRQDMREALTQAFPGARVVALERLDVKAAGQVLPSLIVLDTPLNEIKSSSLVEKWSRTGTRIVLTGTSEKLDLSSCNSWLRVERPFTEKALLDVVRQTD